MRLFTPVMLQSARFGPVVPKSPDHTREKRQALAAWIPMETQAMMVGLGSGIYR